jgi:hypothetical protein
MLGDFKTNRTSYFSSKSERKGLFKSEANDEKSTIAAKVYHGAIVRT